VFFSASGSKLPSYILPMFPPLALVTGWLLLAVQPARLARMILPYAVVVAVLAVIVLARYGNIEARFATDRQPIATLAAFGPWFKGALILFAAGAGGALACFRAGSGRARYAGAALLALSTLAGTQSIVAGLDSFRTTRSAYDILRTAAAHSRAALSDPHIPFYQVHMYDQTVPFYLGRTTTVVAFRDELALGIDAEPGRAIPSEAAWIAAWRKLDAGYALFPPDELARLLREDVPMHVLARDPRRVIVSRR
jgi:4-amino-4-deoxy-L-arabinose transferase-like glycosyltransferase